MHRSPTLAPVAFERGRWRAVLTRDRSADGLFFFGVSTTGIFCRPSCPARRPRREHVSFFESALEAERAGLRPCRRCKPDAGVGSALCQSVLDHVGSRSHRRWSDAALAAAGFDPVQVRRAFVAHFGMTFHAHRRSMRVAQAREHLAAGRSLSEAGARAGYESESGLRAAFRSVLDSTPGEAPQLATMEVTHLDSPLGPLTAAATRAGVCLLEFDSSSPAEFDSPRRSHRRAARSLERLIKRLGCVAIADTNRHLDALREQLEQWFAGSRTQFDVPIVHAGSEFEIEVWRALASIPYGLTSSYGELARKLGRPGAARAIGRANALNPIAILVPCHRVIGGGGALTGYAAGLDRKRWLLEHERSVLAR